VADALPILDCRQQKAWAAWLAKNHATSKGVWLRFQKKASDIPSVTYAEALDVALCYGWIDGQIRPDSATAWLHRFTPRRPRSVWSKRNRDKVAVLIADGLMRPAGQAAIDAAKADGRWDAAYDSPKHMTVPPDFQAALDKAPRAAAAFATLDRANRYAFLWRIHTAKKADTRTERIRLFIAMLRRGETLH
jgi:uncharacterized protein YdeI (YjbR/CyaY-like superfamily)